MQSKAGRIALVTGGNSGLGKEVAHELSARGLSVVLLCRDAERGEAARAELVAGGATVVDVVLLDLASLASVRRAAAALRERYDGIDVLVNNAGIYRHRREKSADGFELTMAVNHLGHFLLTNLLLDRLVVRHGRVVNVTSDAHRAARFERDPVEAILRGDTPYRGMQAYADSKLANILFARELARRTADAGLTACAADPGMISSDFWKRNDDALSRVMRMAAVLLPSPSKSAAAVVTVALDAAIEPGVAPYFSHGKPARPAAAAEDDALARRLWDVSARLLGLD